MEKYSIPVTRIGYAHAIIEVEADSREAAEAIALEEAPNHEFNEHDAEYGVS